MKTIIIKIDLTAREHELLVAANMSGQAGQPPAGRVKALLIAEARSTLRRLIGMVDDERNSASRGSRCAAGSPAAAAKFAADNHVARATRHEAAFATRSKPGTLIVNGKRVRKPSLTKPLSGEALGHVAGFSNPKPRRTLNRRIADLMKE